MMLPTFKPEPVEEQQVINPIASSESIAESMTKEFMYDPDSKDPPKRRIKSAAEAFEYMIEGKKVQNLTTPCNSTPVTHVAIPTPKLDLDREARRKLEQARAQAGVRRLRLRASRPRASRELRQRLLLHVRLTLRPDWWTWGGHLPMTKPRSRQQVTVGM